MFLISLYFAVLTWADLRDVLSPDLFNHSSRSSTSRSDLLKLTPYYDYSDCENQP